MADLTLNLERFSAKLATTLRQHGSSLPIVALRHPPAEGESEQGQVLGTLDTKIRVSVFVMWLPKHRQVLTFL
jgi:hypothetical protein